MITKRSQIINPWGVTFQFYFNTQLSTCRDWQALYF